MRNWQEYYNSHMTTAEDIASRIQSGDRIWIGNTANVPYDELDVLADRYEELTDVKIYSNQLAGQLKMLSDPKYGKAFHHYTYYPSRFDRAGFDMGMMDYLSIGYGYFIDAAKNVNKIDTLYTVVTPPDEDGYVNLSSWGAFIGAELYQFDTIKHIYGVVNKYFPVADSDDPTLLRIPVERFDAFCENHQPLAVLTESAPEPIDEKIASYIMEFIDDGDYIQIGKGGLGNAIGHCLTEMNHINVYTELISDWTVALDKAGVLDSVRSAGCFGSQELYDYSAIPGKVVFDTVCRLVNYDRVAQLPSLIGINSCMMVDLTGQSCSEGSGPWQYSCASGQLEWVKSINRKRNEGKKGVNILALRSTRTDKEGNVHSNVKFSFPPASAITCPRSEAMYYVTEYGVADLWGKPLNERVVAMIGIAHPDFREELKAQAIEARLARPSDFE